MIAQPHSFGLGREGYNLRMDCPVRRDGEIAVISPQGRITIGEPAETFARAVDAALASGARYLLVDCTRVPYADSSGIGELLAAMRHARGAGGGVGLFGPQGKIHEVLEITKLKDYFAIGETEEGVRSRLRSAGS